jgi:adenylyltransferase/sulfurtransferase
MVRAGVGTVRIVDRDIVELTNLQRQVLFDEQDVREQLPKAVAAVNRLRRINSDVDIEAVVADVHAGNIEELAGLVDGEKPVDLILDGTDSIETRYLLNDFSVKYSVPWVYGACVGMAGRAMAFRPPATACLRCLFHSPMGAGELPTCDTAGVFSPVPAIVASLQSSAAMKILVGKAEAGDAMFVIDLWDNHVRAIATTDAKRGDCICCGQRRFEFLETRAGSTTANLCGRNSVQVRPPPGHVTFDMGLLAQKLTAVGQVERTPYLVRCQLSQSGLNLTLFPDGRLIVQGTTDADRARSVYAKYIGV